MILFVFDVVGTDDDLKFVDWRAGYEALRII